MSRRSFKSEQTQIADIRTNPIQNLIQVMSLVDNSPTSGIQGFGKSGTQKYYVFSQPTETDLYKMARCMAIGYRVVYDFAKMVWSNKFKLKFIGEIEDEVAREKNKALLKHLHDIHFFREGERWYAYDREQGESLLHIHREGDWNGYVGKKINERQNQITKEVVMQLSEDPNVNKPVWRVEAINLVDYSVPIVGNFGEAEYYNISFYKNWGNIITYKVNKKRAIRMKIRNIEYDQYAGQSVLRAIYPDLMILAHIIRAVGDACYRWGVGVPLILTKMLNTTEERLDMKNALAGITSQAFVMLASENVSEIDTLGKDVSNLNIGQIIEPIMNDIIAGVRIPRNILMGEKMGVIRAGEVNQDEMLALLDGEHSALDPYIREFFDLDPEIREIIGDLEYEIDWGLRKAMTDVEKAELNQKLYDNARDLIGLGVPLNMVLTEANKPIFEKIHENKLSKKLYKDMFGYTPEELGLLPAITVLRLFNISTETVDGEETEKTKPKPEIKETKPKPENKVKEKKEVKDERVENIRSRIKQDINNLRGIYGNLPLVAANFNISQGTLHKLLDSIRN